MSAHAHTNTRAIPQPALTAIARRVTPRENFTNLDEAKLHIRVDQNAEDSEVQNAIDAAHATAEDETLRNLVLGVWDFVYPSFPLGNGAFLLPLPPTQNIISINYVDASGSVVPYTDFRLVQSQSDRSYLENELENWPDTIHDGRREMVTIQARAGYVIPATVDTASDTFTALGQEFAVGDLITFSISGGNDRVLPLPIVARRDYQILTSDPVTGNFTLDDGSGGTLDITADPVGDMFTGTMPADLRQAINILTSHYYENRELVAIGPNVNPIPQSAQQILGRSRVAYEVF